jgi:L-threonylcarbamoyladenylate synthase
MAPPYFIKSQLKHMSCAIGTDVAQAATILKEGGLVAFATETVYGLGAVAFDTVAVARVFEVKQRPSFDPLIIHIADPARLDELTMDVPDKARMLAEKFWPGPLTLVLPKKPEVPDLVSAGLSTVAVRIPGHPRALELLHAVNRPVAAPSANPFGHLSPTRAEDVADQLGDRIDYILDGGPCSVGVESTVLQVTDTDLRILRPGGATVEEIESVAGPVILVETSKRPGTTAPASPGMLPKHYAPRTPVRIVHDVSSADCIKRVGVLTLAPIDGLRCEAIEVLSSTSNLTEAAANFFAALRRLDAQDLDLILALPFPEEGLGRALNDRLQRAASSS